MDTAETLTLTLPPLLHIVFYTGGVGILAALLGNALFTRSTSPVLLPAIWRSLFLTITGSALHSFYIQGLDALRIGLEIALLFLIIAGTVIHSRCILKSGTSVSTILKNQTRLLLRHFILMMIVMIVFIATTGGIWFVLNALQSTPQGDMLTLPFMIALNSFLIALFYLTHTRIPHDKESTKNSLRQSLRIILWPLILALFMFIFPLMLEKYVQSDAYARLLNPPQRLQKI